MTDDWSPAPEAAAIREAVGDARTVLLLTAGDDPLDDECCVALDSADDPEETQRLFVTVGGPPSSRLAAWRAHVGGLPARTGVIAVGETTRGAAATDGGSVSPGNGPVSVDTLEDPSDLAGLALAIDTYLRAWDATEEGAEATAATTVCLHTLSGLLEAAGLERVFRFLHATSGLLRRRGATGHVHLDPAEHDAATVDTLGVLFDAVVRIGDDGGVSVSGR